MSEQRYRILFLGPGQDYRDPLNQEATLFITRDLFGPGSRREVMKRDGTWTNVIEGAEPGDDIGYKFPAESIEAVQQAINQYLGKASHHETEVAILREWLMTERSRVEDFLQRTQAQMTFNSNIEEKKP